MFEELFSHIARKVTLTVPEMESVRPFFTYRKLGRREFFLRQDERSEYICFVSRGLLRSYNVDERGSERMNFFAWEGRWSSDLHSFSTGKKALFNIDALEDTELLLLSHENLERMTLEVPKMDRYFRMLFQNSLAEKDRRLSSANSHNAAEKYQDLVIRNPEIFRRIPQHMIASYLGITPETLSRLKKSLISGS